MAQERVITVWASKGGMKKYTTAVSTWGELKNIVKGDYDLKNMQGTEMVNKGVLEHDEAVLPAGDFKLFFKPVKTKAGANYSEMSFKELRGVINAEGDDLKKYLTESVKAEGRNWTQMKTPELQEALAKYFAERSNSQPEEATATNVADVVDSVAQAKEEAQQEEVAEEELTFVEEAETAAQFFVDLLDHEDEEIRERAECLVDDIQALLESIKEKEGVEPSTATPSVKSQEEIEAERKAEEERKQRAEEEARKKAEAEALRKEEEELAREAEKFFK